MASSTDTSEDQIKGDDAPALPNRFSPHAADLGETLGHSPFGNALEPVLRQVNDGRLSRVNWFRTAWQRGGALTGYATWRDDHGQPRHAVVKVPVPPRERQWLRVLQGPQRVVPDLFAHGDSLGPYDLAWVVMERLPHGPLSEAWRGHEFDLMVQAAGRFYQAASTVPMTDMDHPRNRDWETLLGQARKQIQTSRLPEGQRWKAALKRAHKKIDGWLEKWHARSTTDWCHGDLHLGNAMCRDAAPDDTAAGVVLSENLHEHDAHEATDTALLDLAEVRVGHWVEDAVYLEHLYWGARHRLAGRKVVSMLAQERKRRGLPVGEDWPQLASIRRALVAMVVPTHINDVPPTHANAALAVLEREVG